MRQKRHNLRAEKKAMTRQNDRFKLHARAKILFFVAGLASLFMVYVATAAPQKSMPNKNELVEKPEPSLFAPSIKKSSKEDVQRRRPIVEMERKKSPGASAHDWTRDFDVQRQSNEGWEQAYFNFFQKHQVHPQTVRLRIRGLTDQQSPDLQQVIGILRAAIRAGQIQPWMYEALALAMRIEKSPQAEIERVLLSSADFATSANQVIFLAEYMDRLGYRQRALDLLRQVTLRDPSADFVYAKALDLAIYLDDDEAMQWATLGVLSQEWSRDDKAVFNKAVRQSKALIESLRKQGKHQQADEYATGIKKALQRDIVVKVSWTGDADVDLMVEEPSGSVCSYRQNKTPGGGRLVGDAGSGGAVGGEGHSEIYSCPKAFSGDYRFLLRQIWGRIPAGRVTVDAWTHLGTENETHIQKVIPLDENGALVSFEMENGRRQESLADHQLANDVIHQVAVNRSILAQQLEAISNPDALVNQQNYAQSQPAAQIGNRFDPRNRTAPNAFNPNLVGYQPQITLLPIGMTMEANAVVSADRRYVRITAVPFFSSVKRVVQYNLQTGVTDQTESDQAFANADLNIAADGGGGGDGGNEFSLIVSVPEPVPAGATIPRAGTVTRTGSTANALAVTLSGANSATAIVSPLAISIPAGQTGAFFNIQGVAAGATSVTATGGGQSSSANITVQ